MTKDDVIREFNALSAIPRCSGNEKAAAGYIAGLADKAGYRYQTDKAGNIAVFLPPSVGMEEAPGFILQSHIDMVCVRDEGVPHDFKKDPIIPVQEGDYITANGTTLGADNGIGVALALAVMKDRDLPHGSLELLFTVEEETGLIGATNLGEAMLEGRYLINLDFEEDDQICIGCAGGVLITAEGKLSVEPGAQEGCVHWRLAARGLKGGHSGMDIGTSPENLFKTTADFLEDLTDIGVLITGIAGDGKTNAIPTNWTVTFLLPEKNEPSLRDRYDRFKKAFMETYSDKEVTPRISLDKTETATPTVLTDKGFRTLLTLIKDLPSGVLAVNRELGGLTSTSANPGVLTVDSAGSVHLEISFRSDRQEALDEGETVIRELLGKAGLHITNTTTYPAWPPAPHSELVALCRDCREGIFEGPVEVLAIHAGLECGILSAKAKGLDSVSLGPNVFDVHTTRERIQVSSLEKFTAWLQRILARQGELQ